jgi:hypothetical protein
MQLLSIINDISKFLKTELLLYVQPNLTLQLLKFAYTVYLSTTERGMRDLIDPPRGFMILLLPDDGSRNSFRKKCLPSIPPIVYILLVKAFSYITYE